MDGQVIVRTPEERDRALDVLGTKVDVLATGPSGGVTVQRGAEGTGPPPHHHAWDETFYVLDGKIEFTCAGKASMCDAGTLVHVPANTVHSFRYGPGGGEMLEFTGPGSQAAPMFVALDDEMPQDAPDIPKAVEILGRHGVTIDM